MAHINELVDFCVETYVVHGSKVLLRFHDKYKLWLSVGGHIELDEDPNQAAIREIKEEVGLDVVLHDKLLPFAEETEEYKELIPPYFLNIHKINDTHRHIAMVYFARSDSESVVEQPKEKSGGLKWMTKDDLQVATDIKPSVKFYALKALEELGE